MLTCMLCRSRKLRSQWSLKEEVSIIIMVNGYDQSNDEFFHTEISILSMVWYGMRNIFTQLVRTCRSITENTSSA